MLFLIVLVLPAPSALANSDGPFNPGLGTNMTGIGTVAWQNPAEIVTPGSPYASATLTQGSLYSNYLQGTQYGFNIPEDVTITGIEVQVNRRVDDHNTNIMDNQVRLVKEGVIIGENRANTIVWPVSFSLVTYGGPTDLWGVSWTPAEINSPDFGVVLAAYHSNSGSNLRQAIVDSVQITVYYGYPTAAELDCGDGTPIAYGDSLSCVITVTRLSGDLTPSGLVDWATDGSGTFEPNPCTLEGATGSCTGVLGEDLEGLDLDGTTHTDAGSYTDPWTFTDESGNYNNGKGEVVDNITRAEATCDVEGYMLEYDRQAHTASGTCTGVLGEDLEGLDLDGTAHMDIGAYPGDPWAFSDVTGNYNDQAGTVDDEITLRFVTVTADALSKMVGQPDPPLTYQLTASSLLEGDEFSGALTRQPGEAPGTYAILLGTLSLPDYYQPDYIGANFTIFGTRLLLPIIRR